MKKRSVETLFLTFERLTPELLIKGHSKGPKISAKLYLECLKIPPTILETHRAKDYYTARQRYFQAKVRQAK